MRRRSFSSLEPDRSRLSFTIGASVAKLVLISSALVGLVTVSVVYLTRPAQAATFTAATNGAWNLGATWGNAGNNVAGSGFPGVADTANIPSGISVTIASGRTEACTALNLNSDALTSAALNLADSTSALNVSGTATVGTAGSAAGTVSLSVDSGAFTCNALTFVDNTKDVGQIRISTGTATVMNNIALVGGAARSKILFTGAGTLNVGGSLGGGGSITSFSGSTVNYNGAAQTIFPATYENLMLSGSGTKTMSGATIVNSTCTVGSGTTLDESSRTMTLPGGATVVVNGTLDFTDTAGLMQSGTSGTTTLTMGTAGLIRTLDSVGLGPAAGASLQTQASGTWVVSSISTNGTVEYNRNATNGQAVTDRDYNNLTITGSSQTKTWTLGATRTINGNVNLNASAPLILSGAQTVNVKGDWSNSGSFTAGTSTINFNGAANQTIGGSSLTTFSTLAISNTGSAPAGTNKVSLANNAAVSTALNVTSGVFDQGASSNLTSSTVTVSSGATLQNLGTGDLTLSGSVANAGTINYNANGNTCGDNDDILIRSSASPTQRLWTGLGTFSMTDVDVKDQAGTALIVVTSGTNSGNNGVNWSFVGACPGAQTYTWAGPIGGTDSYTNPANWSPTRFIANVNDVLVIDGSSRPAPSISSVPTETIARLQLINGTDATLTTSSANTLTISGGAGTDLDIANASRLTLSGSSPITISLATGVTGNVNSFMVFQGANHRLLAADAGSLTFPSTSVFTTGTGFTGNAFGTTNAGSIIFASGSTYIHNAGSSPFGSVGGAAVCIFQTGSEARYLTSTGFDANGRTYANLTIGDGSSAINASDSGAGNFQFDNLAINSPGSSASSSLTYSGSVSSTITIQGNITSLGNGNGGTLPDVILTPGPSGNIQIKVPGAGGTITFANQAGPARSIDFEGDATVDTNTTVNLGRIVQMGLTPTRTITINGTIAPNYLGSAGYFIGKEKRTFAGPGPVDFTFDVGTINGYSPVDSRNTNATGDLTVTATQTTAPVVNAATSLERYWTLNGSGITADVTFHYLDPTDIAGTEANYSIIRVESGTSVSFPNSCPSGSACVDFANNKATIQAVSSFSDWTLGENVAPTAVRLNDFSATSQDDGVMIEWRSGFEANNLGYNLYRYQDGQRTRVTPSLIAGSSLIRKQGSDLASGFSYGWFDPQGAVGTQYELQAIDLRGDMQTFTPRYIAKTGSHDKQKQDRALMLSEVSATSAGSSEPRGWANRSVTLPTKQENPAGTQSLVTQQWIASQPAVKIKVRQPGWYRVTQPQLVANGFDPSVDARRLQLYVDGAEIPVRLSTDKAKLGSGDTLEFYGVGLDLLTTDTRTYYLVNGTRNGLRIPTNPEQGTGNGKKAEVLAPDFLYTVESKERFAYFPGLLNGGNGNIFGQFIESVPANQTVTLANIDTSSRADAQLEVVVQGLTALEHHIQIQFNGSYVGTIDFTGATNKSKTLPVSAASLREGANTVTLTATGGDLDYGAVDVLRVTYAHTYRADNDWLSFSVGNHSAAVSGFSTPSIRVIDITNPNAVFELAPKITNSGGSYGFIVQTSGTTQNLIAFVDSFTRQPSAIVKNQPSTWNTATNAADLVIVTHGDFRTSADSLAAARRAQSMKVSVVDIEDVYDEFSYGAHTPEAVKAFLAWSNTHWITTPRYVLLFGDSSWDPRNFMGQGYNDYVPTKQLDTAELETASDDWLADFDGDGIPEIALGRLPARTAADGSTMVSKILSYDHERAAGGSLRGALLVADGGFEGQSARVQLLLAPLTVVQTLNRSAIGNDSLMRSEIIDAIDQGPTIVNYFGHGSVTVWTGAGLLDEDSASMLTNSDRQALFVMMTCLNGYASDAYIDSLGETLLKNPRGGAFAVWASSGITEPVGQAEINGQLYRLLLGTQPMTLGDAVRQAKMSTADVDVRRTWILLGDPSMRIK
jgi:hypothetical protein